MVFEAKLRRFMSSIIRRRSGVMVKLLSKGDEVVNSPMMAQEVGSSVSVVGSIGEGGSDGEKRRIAGGEVVGNRGGIAFGDLPRSGLVQTRLCQPQDYAESVWAKDANRLSAGRKPRLCDDGSLGIIPDSPGVGQPSCFLRQESGP